MSRYFIEGVPYSKEDLFQAHVEDRAEFIQDFASTLDTLCDLQMGSKRMLKQNSKKQYVFQYVGIIALDNYLYVILPKYYTDDDAGRILSDTACIKANALAPIMNSIGKYNASDIAKVREQDKVSLHGPSNKEVRQGRIELYRYILQDFATNGLYDVTKRIRELNGEGDIEWNRTVNQIMPVVTRRKPVYLDLITERRVRHTSNIIARIQEAILVEISMTVKRLHLDEVLHFPIYERPVRSLDDLGGRDYARHLLVKERGVQFETRKKMLLQAMIDYLVVGRDSSVNTVFADGTCSYDRVWEDICRVVFDDCGYKDMAKPQWNFQLGSLWDDLLIESDSTAIEEDEDGVDETGAQAGPSIPDVISHIAGTDDWHIVDAKYYKPKWRDGKVSAVPGVGDVIKQYFYELFLKYNESKRQASGEPEINVKSNSFVMPAQISVEDSTRQGGDLLRFRGFVRLEYMEPQQHIRVFEMNPDKAMDLYLRDDRSQARSMLGWMMEQRLESEKKGAEFPAKA